MNLLIVLPFAAICILLIVVGCFTYFCSGTPFQTNGQGYSERLPNPGHDREMMHVFRESSTDEDTTDAHHGSHDEEQELEEPGEAEEFSEVDMAEDENHDSPFTTLHNPFC